MLVYLNDETIIIFFIISFTIIGALAGIIYNLLRNVKPPNEKKIRKIIEKI
jgi:hypothetical protein